MSARFLMTSDETNRFFVNLVDAKGELLLIGGTYSGRDEAEAAVKRNTRRYTHEQSNRRQQNPSGDTFSILKPQRPGHRQSQLFTSAMAFDNALHQVKDNTCIAELDDLTAQNA